MASEMPEHQAAYEKFESFCIETLDSDGPTVLKKLHKKYSRCSRKVRASPEMVKLIEDTMGNMRREPARAFVHLKTLVNQLELWSKANTARRSYEEKKSTGESKVETTSSKVEATGSKVDTAGSRVDQTGSGVEVAENCPEVEGETSKFEAVEIKQEVEEHCESNLGFRLALNTIVNPCMVVLNKVNMAMKEKGEEDERMEVELPKKSDRKLKSVSVTDGNVDQAQTIEYGDSVNLLIIKDEIMITTFSKSVLDRKHHGSLSLKGSSQDEATSEDDQCKSSVSSPISNRTPRGSPRSTVITEVRNDAPNVAKIKRALWAGDAADKAGSSTMSSHSKAARAISISDVSDSECVDSAEQMKTASNTLHSLVDKENIDANKAPSEDKTASSPCTPISSIDNVSKQSTVDSSIKWPADKTACSSHSVEIVEISSNTSVSGPQNIVPSSYGTSVMVNTTQHDISPSISLHSDLNEGDKIAKVTTDCLPSACDDLTKATSVPAVNVESVPPNQDDESTEGGSVSSVDGVSLLCTRENPADCDSDKSDVKGIKSADKEKGSSCKDLQDSSSSLISSSKLVEKADGRLEEEQGMLPLKCASTSHSLAKEESGIDCKDKFESSEIEIVELEEKKDKSLELGVSVSKAKSKNDGGKPGNDQTDVKDKGENIARTPGCANWSLSQTDDDCVIIVGVEETGAVKGSREIPQVAQKGCDEDDKDSVNDCGHKILSEEYSVGSVKTEQKKKENMDSLTYLSLNKHKSLQDGGSKGSDGEKEAGSLLKPKKRVALLASTSTASASGSAFMKSSNDCFSGMKAKGSKVRKFSKLNLLEEGDSSGAEFLSETDFEKRKKAQEEKRRRDEEEKNLPEEERKRLQNIRRLENLLEKLRNEIEKCQTKEMSLEDLDEENSSYIYEDKLKKKFVDAWTKLCEITERTVTTGRPTERSIKFHSTRYKEINRQLEKFLNKKKVFPDIHDVKRIIHRTNKKYSLNLSGPSMRDIAREAFVDIGEMLQRRRHQDFIATFGTRQTDALRGYHRDPYYTDPVLQRKLDNNRQTAKSNLERVIAKYSKLQDQRQRGDDDSDEDDDDDVSSKGRVAVIGKTGIDSSSDDDEKAEESEDEEAEVNRQRRERRAPLLSSEDEQKEGEDDKEDDSSSDTYECGPDGLKRLRPSKYVHPVEEPTTTSTIKANSASGGTPGGLSEDDRVVDDDTDNHLQSVGILSLPVNPYIHNKVHGGQVTPQKSRSQISSSLPASPSSFVVVEDSPLKPSVSSKSQHSPLLDTDAKCVSDQENKEGGDSIDSGEEIVENMEVDEQNIEHVEDDEDNIEQDDDKNDGDYKNDIEHVEDDEDDIEHVDKNVEDDEENIEGTEDANDDGDSKEDSPSCYIDIVEDEEDVDANEQLFLFSSDPKEDHVHVKTSSLDENNCEDLEDSAVVKTNVGSPKISETSEETNIDQNSLDEDFKELTNIQRQCRDSVSEPSDKAKTGTSTCSADAKIGKMHLGEHSQLLDTNKELCVSESCQNNIEDKANQPGISSPDEQCAESSLKLTGDKSENSLPAKGLMDKNKGTYTQSDGTLQGSEVMRAVTDIVNKLVTNAVALVNDNDLDISEKRSNSNVCMSETEKKYESCEVDVLAEGLKIAESVAGNECLETAATEVEANAVKCVEVTEQEDTGGEKLRQTEDLLTVDGESIMAVQEESEADGSENGNQVLKVNAEGSSSEVVVKGKDRDGKSGKNNAKDQNVVEVGENHKSGEGKDVTSEKDRKEQSTVGAGEDAKSEEGINGKSEKTKDVRSREEEERSTGDGKGEKSREGKNETSEGDGKEQSILGADHETEDDGGCEGIQIVSCQGNYVDDSRSDPDIAVEGMVTESGAGENTSEEQQSTNASSCSTEDLGESFKNRGLKEKDNSPSTIDDQENLDKISIVDLHREMEFDMESVLVSEDSDPISNVRKGILESDVTHDIMSGDCKGASDKEAINSQNDASVEGDDHSKSKDNFERSVCETAEFIGNLCNSLIENAMDETENKKETVVSAKCEKENSGLQENTGSGDVDTCQSTVASTCGNPKQCDTKESGESIEKEEEEEVVIIEELSDPKGVRVSKKSKEEDRKIVDDLLSAIKLPLLKTVDSKKKDQTQSAGEQKPDDGSSSKDRSCEGSPKTGKNDDVLKDKMSLIAKHVSPNRVNEDKSAVGQNNGDDNKMDNENEKPSSEKEENGEHNVPCKRGDKACDTGAIDKDGEATVESEIDEGSGKTASTNTSTPETSNDEQESPESKSKDNSSPCKVLGDKCIEDSGEQKEDRIGDVNEDNEKDVEGKQTSKEDGDQKNSTVEKGNSKPEAKEKVDGGEDFQETSSISQNNSDDAGQKSYVDKNIKTCEKQERASSSGLLKRKNDSETETCINVEKDKAVASTSFVSDEPSAKKSKVDYGSDVDFINNIIKTVYRDKQPKGSTSQSEPADGSNDNDDNDIILVGETKKPKPLARPVIGTPRHSMYKNSSSGKTVAPNGQFKTGCIPFPKSPHKTTMKAVNTGEKVLIGRPSSFNSTPNGHKIITARPYNRYTSPFKKSPSQQHGLSAKQINPGWLTTKSPQQSSLPVYPSAAAMLQQSANKPPKMPTLGPRVPIPSVNAPTFSQSTSSSRSSSYIMNHRQQQQNSQFPQYKRCGGGNSTNVHRMSHLNKPMRHQSLAGVLPSSPSSSSHNLGVPVGVSERAAARVTGQTQILQGGRFPAQLPVINIRSNNGIHGKHKLSPPNRTMSSYHHGNASSMPPPRKKMRDLNGLRINLDDDVDVVQPKPRIVSVCSLSKNKPSSSPTKSASRNFSNKTITKSVQVEEIVLSDSD